MKIFLWLSVSLLISIIPVFGESHPEYSAMTNPTEYVLEFDEQIFSIPYEVNANIIAMEIDPDLTSLLIALESDSDSIFQIDLQHELINAQNNEFAILVNGLEVDYDIVSDVDRSTLTFFVPQSTEEIEIIGTHVIPEFPFGAIAGLSVLIISVMVFSRLKLPMFRL
ncbi:MAG: hypothetical protein PVJ16_09460 [Nitrosopumilaceae archaeon]|jgi:hypothetical protein